MTRADKTPSILLIVGGGIAAYKSLELIRLLRGAEIEVRVVLTKAGAQFVTPLSLASLSGNKVYEDLFSLTDETEMGHIELSRQADLVVIAPATADLLAKAAQGLANDLASTLLLASDKTDARRAGDELAHVDPSGDAAQSARACATDGMKFIGPNEGAMACGEFGPGRMAEPAEIFAAIQAALKRADLQRELAKASPERRWSSPPGRPMSRSTPSAIIANRSSGKQGYAIAERRAGGGRRGHFDFRAGLSCRAPRRARYRRRNRARDGGGGRSRAALRHFHRRRRRRGLARRRRQRPENQEGRRGPACCCN